MLREYFTARSVAILAVVAAGVIAYVAWSVTAHPYAHFGEQSKAVSDDLNSRHLAIRMAQANVLNAWLDPREATPRVVLDVVQDGKNFQYVSTEAGGYVAPSLATSAHQVIGYMIEVKSAANRGVWIVAHTTANREMSNAHEVAKGIEGSVIYTIDEMLTKEKENNDRAASWAADGVPH